MLPLNDNVSELNNDFSTENLVVISPALPNPSASDPAIKATRAFNTWSSGSSESDTTTSGPLSYTRRTERFEEARKAQCHSSGSALEERRGGISLRASARVLRVRLTRTRAPARKATFSRNEGRKRSEEHTSELQSRSDLVC